MEISEGNDFLLDFFFETIRVYPFENEQISHILTHSFFLGQKDIQLNINK